MLYEYYVVYKPYMVMCQFSPIESKKTLSDLNLGLKNDIYPVGRLDEDSEGLLILTNDKSLTDRILNPKNSHKRTYFVQVEGTINQEAISKLEKGNIAIKIKDKIHFTLPAKAEIISEPVFLPERNPPIRFRANIQTSWLSLTLIEGKNRQVRKMTAALGFPTLRLVRYSIENLTIKDFKSGEIRKVHLKLLV
ncbi:MAG: pseudouridine synthase [Bacteroidetes bacterium]|nr:MAG: pseudouridine synthase [Bacteroidota bacterium]